ncbi:MAG: competence/damage-inducible protein A [Verrucomicrobiota bacterium]|nr:competence/damage-inducible protein A [Chthoniobacterales bacterium]MDQ3544894.1 competence/damage-inducible protein A [Verrucomicrobiota bacterium]
MRVTVINTGTEILLGDVLNTHLTFIAQEIFPLGLRVERQLTVPDGDAIRAALQENFESAEIIFVTGGLGPTTDDITREVTAELLGLDLVADPELERTITHRLQSRGIRLTSRILRQAQVPRGARVLPNENGSAPGLYLPAGVSSSVSPHLFLLPGPPRELQPMFAEIVLPVLQQIVRQGETLGCRTYRIVGMGESYVEEAVGEQLLAISGLELGYCARMGEVDLRVIGSATVIEQAETVVRTKLGSLVLSTTGENLETVIVRQLAARKRTLAVAESCTGGFLAHRLTNVPGSSEVFLAGYVTYANEAKSATLGVDPALISKHGAVSEPVGRAMADGALKKSGAVFALATTGIAGPGGGSEAKPVGTACVALAGGGETIVRHLFFPTDRETFKQLVTQMALNLLRERLASA